MVLSTPAPIDDSKFFEAALSLAQSLSQWDLLILGGSLVVIVSTSYYRPKTLKVRAAYFLFIPTWLCLAISVYQGIAVQRSYVAYLVASRSTPPQQHTIDQIARQHHRRHPIRDLRSRDRPALRSPLASHLHHLVDLL